MANDVKIKIKSQNMFQRGISRAISGIKKMGQTARAIGSGIATAMKAAAVAMAAIGGVSAVMVRAFLKQDEAEKQLAAAIRNHGGEVDKLIPRYKEFAAGIQKVTRFGDEEILSQMAYARNLGVTEGQLEDVTRAAVGLAAKLRIDLRASMMLLGRASQGETSTLSRYGIKLDETLTKQEKFNAILKIGANSFGLAEDDAQSLAGRLDQLKNSWGDLLETGGGAIDQAVGLSSVFQKLQAAINALVASGKMTLWAKNTKDALKSLIPVAKVIGAIFAVTKEQIERTAGFAGGFSGGEGFGGRIKAGISGAIETPGALKEENARKLDAIREAIEKQTATTESLKRPE